MLKVNLDGKPVTRRTLGIWGYYAGVFAFVVLATVFALISHERVDAHVVGVEEKELIISILSSLESRNPDVANWSSELREQIESDDVRVWSDTSTSELVQLRDDELFLGSSFFRSDTATQRNAFLNILVQRNARENPLQDEVAVTGE